MPNEPAGNEGLIDEQLVAYLDGELDAEGSRRIEERLSREPALRARLQRLERAWGMLDRLETPPLATQFAQSTMEMVAVAAREDAEKSQGAIPRLGRRRWAAVAASFAAAALAGVLTVGLLLPDPNKELLRDLPVLMNLEDYCYKDGTDCYWADHEFLKRLQEQGLFVKDAGQAAADSPDPPDEEDEPIDRMTRARRKKLVQGMPLEEKIRLANALTQFQALPAEEKEQVRKLHEQLEADPGLRGVSQCYHRWLAALPAHERTGVLKTAETSEQRIGKIEELLAGKAPPSGEFAGPKPMVPNFEDWIGMMHWARVYASRNKEHILQMHPELQHHFAGMTETMKERVVAFLTFLHLQKLNQDGKLNPKVLDELRGHLSKKTQAQLASKSAPERILILRNWLLAARKRIAGRQFLESVLVQVDDRELALFERKLTPQERDQLRYAPPEKKTEKLRGLYFARMIKVIGSVAPRSGSMGRPPDEAPVVRPGPGGKRPFGHRPYRDPGFHNPQKLRGQPFPLDHPPEGKRVPQPFEQGRPKTDEEVRPEFGRELHRDFPPPREPKRP